MGKTSEPTEPKKTSARRNGACPSCRTGITETQVIVEGMIHARATRAGGPFHTLLCPGCQVRLVAERSESKLVFATEGALAEGSGILKKLRSFLGMPRGSTGGRATDPFVIPRLGRPVPPKNLRDRAKGESGRRDPNRTQAKKPLPGERFREPLRVLGLGVESSLADVKRRFRELAKELHPDLLSHKSPEEQGAAQKQFLLVKNAYETIQRGWKGH